jgi:hypothetical protein
MLGGAWNLEGGGEANLTITSACGKKTNLVVPHKQTIVTPYCETDPVENIV